MQRVAVLVLLACLAAPAAAETPAEVRALGKALHDPDLAKAAVAAKRLRELGAEAEPAVQDLMRAMDRTIPEPLRKRIWHEWSGILPTYRRDVVASLLAVGPPAKAALPKLLDYLGRSRGYPRRPLDWMVEPLFDEWRGKVPGARAGLLAWARAGHLGVSKPLRQRILDWLVSLGAETHSLWDHWIQHRVQDGGLALRVLHEAGPAGLPILAKHFPRDRAIQDAMLKTWIRAGDLPAFAHEEALGRLADGSLERHAPELVAILSRVEFDLAPQLVAKLRPPRFHFSTWRALSAQGGAFGQRVGRLWYAAHAPKPSLKGFGEDGQRATAALGGPGGETFRESPGGLLVGLNYTYGMVNWAPAIRSIQGMYWHKGKMIAGRVFGTHGAKRGKVMSKPGYAIGGLYAQQGARFQGFAVIYMRHVEGRLDPNDAYIDTWHGSSITGHDEFRIGGEGFEIVGLHGRAGADIDALGLVERRPPPSQGTADK